jgi:hypothetical protein
MKRLFYLSTICCLLAGCNYPELSIDEIKQVAKGDTSTVPVKGIVFDSFSVYSDNNGDKIINKGETIKLKVSLKNTGASAAISVKAAFSTTSSYVSGFSPTTQINYGDISANKIKWADYRGNSVYEYTVDYTIQFTVSNSTPANTPIPINISIVDESGNTWTDSFDVTVS